MSRGPRERDRGGSSSSRGSPSDESSAESRQKLEALFNGGQGGGRRDERGGGGGGGGGGRRDGRVFASPRKSMGRSPSEYRMRLERLRIAREVEEIREAADAFLAHHQLPDDVDILYKVLQHPSEKVVREALGQIASLLMQGRTNGGIVLEDRLTALEERVTEDATRSFISGVRSQLERMKKEAPPT